MKVRKRKSKGQSIWALVLAVLAGVVLVLGFQIATTARQTSDCEKAQERYQAFTICAKAPPGSVCILGIDNILQFRDDHRTLRGSTCSGRE